MIYAGATILDKIVMSPLANRTIQYAANELQKYLSRIVGKAFRCVLSDKPESGSLYLCESPDYAISDSNKDKYDRIGVHVYSDHVILAGENTLSVLYAVYDFLKHYFGCRFYSSADCYEYIPQLDTLHLRENTCFHDGSAFAIRDFVNRTNTFETLSFAVKNRINTILGCGPWVNGSENCSAESAALVRSFGLKMRGPGHSWKHFIPDASLFDSHPEYFPLLHGKRTVNGRTACFSNPAVRRIFQENVRNYITEHPYWDIYAFWAEDMIEGHYCECDECMKMHTTDWYFVLANETAKTVADMLPEAKFEIIVYQDTNLLPEHCSSLHNDGRNMLINFCFNQTRDLFRPFEQRTFTNNKLFELFSNWQSFLNRIHYQGQSMIMEYYNLCEYPDSGPCGRALLWPTDVMQADAQFYLKRGINGMGAFTGFDRLAFPTPFRLWAWIQLWSDPNLDLEKMKEEFYRHYFGDKNGDTLRKLDDAFYHLMLQEASNDNIAQLHQLAEKYAAFDNEERIDVLKSSLDLAIRAKELYWAYMKCDRNEFETRKKRYLDFQSEYAPLLARAVRPFPMLWFNFWFDKIGWRKDGTRIEIRDGLFGMLQ